MAPLSKVLYVIFCYVIIFDYVHHKYILKKTNK